VKLVGLVRKRPPTDPGRIKAVKDVLFVASLAFRYMFLWRGGVDWFLLSSLLGLQLSH